MSVEAPLVFDTTEADVVRAALETYPGRPVVNSINLESGRARCDAVLPLVRDHGAAVIALTIDNSPDGEGESPENGKLVSYVEQALADVAAGRPVATPRTRTNG